MYDFEGIIGNERIIKSLKLAIKNNRINHAYIFDGSLGSGKRAIANAFAKTLNCEEGGTQPCGKCVSCETFETQNNPDIFYIKRDEGDREIKIDAVRNIINKNITTKPYRNRYKVFIIEDADTMNIAAQNAFLKTLEEPPSYAVFLLLTQNYNKLLVTVLSRCQHFKIQQLPADRIKVRLMQQLSISEAQAEVAALYSGGSLGKAIMLASSDEFNSLRNDIIDKVILLLETDLIGLYRLTAQMEEYRAQIETVLDIIYLFYRDALVYINTGDERAIIQRDKIENIKRICSLTGTKRLIRGCELIESAIDNIRKRGDFQLVIENLFFKLKEK